MAINEITYYHAWKLGLSIEEVKLLQTALRDFIEGPSVKYHGDGDEFANERMAEIIMKKLFEC